MNGSTSLVPSNWSPSKYSPLFHTACALLLASYLAPTYSRLECFISTLFNRRSGHKGSIKKRQERKYLKKIPKGVSLDIFLGGSLYLADPAGGDEQVTILESALATSFSLPRFCLDLGDLNVFFLHHKLIGNKDV